MTPAPFLMLSCEKHSNSQRLAPIVSLGIEVAVDPGEVDPVDVVVGDQSGPSDVGISQNEGESWESFRRGAAKVKICREPEASDGGDHDEAVVGDQVGPSEV